MFTFPEDCKIVVVAPTAAANAVVYDIISCKNALKVWFVVFHQGANNTNLVLSLAESTDVAGTASAAVTATFPIWVDADAGATSDTLVKQTDAASYTVNTAAGTDQLVVIEWDLAKFSSGFDCIQLADTGGNGGNYVTAVAVMLTRYPMATPPSAITD